MIVVGINSNWLHQRCFLKGPNVAGVATPPMPSWGSPNANTGDGFENCRFAPTFSWAQNGYISLAVLELPNT